MAITDNEVLYEVRERIATVTLNRPDRMNAVRASMHYSIAHAMSLAANDPEVRVIILTGAGRAFCAGVDMEKLQERSGGNRPIDPKDDPNFLSSIDVGAGPDLGSQFSEMRRYGYFLRIGKPIIAALNGAAAGIGMLMAICSDLRFASDKMIFATSFAQRGIVAEHGMAWLLPRLVGPAHAADLLLSARKVPAAEALAMGLVNRVIPADRLMDEVQAYARILADTVSPRSMAVIKGQIWKAMFQTYSESVFEADRQLALMLPFSDYKEGVAHFVEKRPARFPNLVKSA